MICDSCEKQKHCTINPNRNDCLLFRLKEKTNEKTKSKRL